MTNDAPKRVWVEPSYNAFGDRKWIEGFEGRGQEYIRADHAQAELQAAVAAAYEDAARLVETFGIPRDNFDFHNGNPRPSLAKAIRARAGADALEAVKAEARAEALREASAICDEERHNINALTSNPPQSAACVAARDRILALIPADQEENLND